MSSDSIAELHKRIARLESENLALSNANTPLQTPGGGSPSGAVRHRRNWSWTLLATVLIVIGSLLAPVAVVASWAKLELTDTDHFVSTFAPIASDPAVQKFVTAETVAVIDQHLDVRQLTSEVVDGITSLGTGPAATRALDAMKGPAAAGIENLIQTTVGNVVASDAFATVWRESLQASHAQLIRAVQNDPTALVGLGADGSIGIQLSPVVTAAKSQLLAQGIGFASRIPDVDKTIVITQSDAIPTIQLGYRLAIAAGVWLPWVALLFLGAGVLVARRKAVALMSAAVALALAMAAMVSALAVGFVVFESSVSPSLMPREVADLLFSTMTEPVRALSIALLVLAIAVAVVTWFAGPFHTPQRLRRFFAAGTREVQTAAERQGISTGRTGEWLHRQRKLIRAAIAIMASAVILFSQPMTSGLVLWTLVLAVVVLALLELAQRPVTAARPDTAVTSP